VIAVVVVIAVFFIWRSTTKHAAVVQNPDEFKKAYSQSMSGRGGVTGGGMSSMMRGNAPGGGAPATGSGSPP
jgi:hypothetical protein